MDAIFETPYEMPKDTTLTSYLKNARYILQLEKTLDQKTKDLIWNNLSGIKIDGNKMKWIRLARGLFVIYLKDAIFSYNTVWKYTKYATGDTNCFFIQQMFEMTTKCPF
jgi:hypothetical protein